MKRLAPLQKRTDFRLPDRQRRGAAVVEAALVLPVFIMAMAGIVEFGRAMMVSQLGTNAARRSTAFCT